MDKIQAVSGIVALIGIVLIITALTVPFHNQTCINRTINNTEPCICNECQVCEQCECEPTQCHVCPVCPECPGCQPYNPANNQTDMPILISLKENSDGCIFRCPPEYTYCTYEIIDRYNRTSTGIIERAEIYGTTRGNTCKLWGMA